MNSVNEYLPHGFCIAWNQQLLAMHVISDLLIALAYFSIPAGILYVARKRPDAVLQPIYYLFAAFILACGVTHVMGILTLWIPMYYTQGIAKIVTAAVSVLTAIYLLPKLKVIMALPDLARLTQLNKDLQEEIESRKKSEISLKQSQELALRAQKTQAAFLANMSHEIRTPMNGVLGAIDLLLDTKLDESQQRLVSVSKRSARSLLDLLNDILDISRIESGKLVLRSEKVELGELFEDVSAALSHDAEQKGLDFQCPAGKLPQGVFLADTVRIRQILLNLVGNAIKFTEHGFVWASCRELGRSAQHAVIEFRVKDSGVGIDLAHQDELFKRFTQLDNTSTRRAQGSGLGLAIVKELVTLMDGSLNLFSEPGQGTEVVVVLNLKIAAQDQPAPLAQEVDDSSASPRVQYEGHILVVDDSSMNQMVVCKVLQSMGLHTQVANNGQEAIELLSKNNFDLVLMDGQMPVMDGYEATHLIRSGSLAGVNTAIPVVALTAHAMAGEDEKCYQAGMNDYLTKPLNRDDLNRVLDKYLKKTG